MRLLSVFLGIAGIIGTMHYINGEFSIIINSSLFNNDNTLYIMRTTNIGGMKVELYDSIDELPMLRFHKYNKMLLIDAGIGSNLSDFDSHIEKIMRYLKTKNPELAAIELDNLRQNVYFIQSNVSPQHLAFAVLVRSIDGVPCNDLSDSGLQEVVDKLGTVPIGEMAAQISAAKKKLDDELHNYFPNLYDDAAVKEYYDELRRRTLIMLDAIIDGDTEDRRKEIDEITTSLLLYNRPQSFNGYNNAEIQYDKQFENMCLLISQHLHVDPKRYTVLEYYNAFEYIKKMLKSANSKKKSK